MKTFDIQYNPLRHDRDYYFRKYSENRQVSSETYYIWFNTDWRTWFRSAK